MLAVVFCSGPAGWWSVQSSSCGLLGKAWPILAAREVFRAGLVQRQVCWFLCCLSIVLYNGMLHGIHHGINKALSSHMSMQ